jgi:transcriptional regulator with PAS, ATPase and Fis domain
MPPGSDEAGISDDGATVEAVSITEEMGGSGAAGPVVKRFRLVVIGGDDVGLSKASVGQRMVIGTHQSCDLVLHDATVSRFHCEIAMVADRSVVRDLGSRNATIVNGLSLVEAHLVSGAVLSLGRAQVRFEVPGDVVRLPISERERFGVLVGRSVAMRQVFVHLERAAASESTLLIEGETGTGKEAVSESVHGESARRDHPFLVVDCGAVPRDLLESELFGHERGAFTGAIASRMGAFEAAGGGTLFLDEIGELAPDLQPRLLRALERREIKRVGASAYQRIDVRVIAATNRCLRTEVNAGRFRSDLYYRLAVLHVTLPPLRTRPDDLPILVEHLLESLGPQAQASTLPFRDAAFLAELTRHTWPGNVRELRNYLERCLAMRVAEPLPVGSAVEPAVSVNVGEPLKMGRDRLVRAFERAYLVEIMRRHGGNVTQASRASGIDRIHFYRMLSRHDLR